MRSTFLMMMALLSSPVCHAQTYTFGKSPVLNTDFTRISGLGDSLFFNSWEIYTPNDPHASTTIYTEKNISFSETDGLVLKITPPTQASKGKPFGAGIKSSNRYLYGRYEIIARVPGTPDPHASGWLIGGGSDVDMNGYREVDIFEHAKFSGGQESIQAGVFIGPNGSAEPSHILRRTASIKPSDAFHKYRVDWTPKTVSLFVDDRLVGQVDSGSKAGNKTPLRHEMRIRLDIVDGIRQGASSQSLRVRSVRVYPLITNK